MSKGRADVDVSGRRCVSLFAAGAGAGAAGAALVSRAVGQQRRIPDEHVKRDKANASSDKARGIGCKEGGYREKE